MTEEVKLVKVEYYRQVKPPTLDQFLYRKAVKEAMAEIKGKVGVTINPSTGNPIPESALAAKEALKGLTAKKIAKEHPLWVDEYNREHGKGE
ncbi:hypothetical protein ES703_00365 [subsurface metagenome]